MNHEIELHRLETENTILRAFVKAIEKLINEEPKMGRPTVGSLLEMINIIRMLLAKLHKGLDQISGDAHES